MPELFRHEALPYASPDHFVPTATSVVREALENEERTLVLAEARRVAGLRDALGTDADDVTFVASDEHARNPACLITLIDAFRAGADGRHSFGVNDSSAGRSEPVTLEAQFAHYVLNLEALRTWAVSILCLYDDSTLADTGRQAMHRAHGVVRGFDTNTEFDPDHATALHAVALTPAPPSAARTVVGARGLAHARAFVREQASGFGVVADRIEDLVLAVNEIVTNSLRYGGGSARMAVWEQDGSAICEIRDRGYLPDPLTGRFAPSTSSSGGRGIWLAHNLCDLVQLRSTPAGTTVRMFVDS